MCGTWGARKTPHRIRPKTAESASPLGEGEERRPRWTVLDFGLAASPRQPPSPQPSPSSEREKERRLTGGDRPWPEPRCGRGGCAEDPHPRIESGTGSVQLPRGVGERAVSVSMMGLGVACFDLWVAATVSQRTPVRSLKLVARKTPHRFRPGTAEPASPPGEGEERRGLGRRCWVGGLPGGLSLRLSLTEDLCVA